MRRITRSAARLTIIRPLPRMYATTCTRTKGKNSKTRTRKFSNARACTTKTRIIAKSTQTMPLSKAFSQRDRTRTDTRSRWLCVLRWRLKRKGWRGSLKRRIVKYQSWLSRWRNCRKGWSSMLSQIGLPSNCSRKNRVRNIVSRSKSWS